MALNDEQQLMEEKILSAGYGLKFDAQLHSLKKGLIDKNAYLEKKRITVSDQKLSMIRDFVDSLEEDQKKYYEDDEEGNPIEKAYTDAELDAFGEKNWQIEIDQFDSNIAHNVENLSWIVAEIGFRNEGLVERDPTGTTFYVDPMQNGSTGGTITDAWRYLYQFVNQAREPGDVCICRRVRGGFNPSDEIFINKYSRNKYHNALDNDQTETEGNFNSKRDVGFQAVTAGNRGSGTIIAWNQGTDEYHTPGTTGKNRSGTTVGHLQKTMIGDTHGNGADQTLYGEQGPTPRAVYLQNAYPDHANYQSAFHSTARWKDLYSTTNPRDKSRLVHLQHKHWDMYSTDHLTNRLQPNSSGDINNPIIVTADFENVWQDFLDTGIEETGITGWGHDGDDTQYVVEVGSKIIRRRTSAGDPVEVHSYITPGDWIFVGQLTTDSVRKVDSTYSDDPYEYSYQVRDVNYDKIVLWLPYKGDQAGSDKRLVSMGYAPRMFSNNWQNDQFNCDQSHQGSHMYCDGDSNWLWQGIEWFDSWSEHTSTFTEHRNIQLYFNGSTTMKFKDCSFFGQSHSDSHQWNIANANFNKRHTTAIIRTNYDGNNTDFEKCVFGNTRHVVFDYYTGESYHGQSNHKFNDCLMNGSIMDNQFSNTSVPNDHYTWYYGMHMRTSHRYPHSVVYSRRSDAYEFNDCEMVNWKYQIFKVMPQTEIKCRGVKFLGAGMDFVDPTATNDADAQENLGLRYSRALFAGDNAIHPKTAGGTKKNNHLGTADATGGWTYDMIYPNGDATAHGPNSSNKVIDMSSASETFGKFTTYAWANMGSKAFVHTQSNLTIGTGSGATTTNGASPGTNSMTRVDMTRVYRDTGWRTNASANSAGAYGYSYQPTSGLEAISSVNNETQTYGSDPDGWNDNQAGQPTSGQWDGTGTGQTDWDNNLVFNGAMAIMGAKGFDDNGGLVWDWDQNWRIGNGDPHNATTTSRDVTTGTGCGGSWALRTDDTTTASPNGIVRYPHVYGGVRIPPSIGELMGRWFCWFPFYRCNVAGTEGVYKWNWPSYHSNNDSGSDSIERTSNNTTLAPKNDSADNRSNDGAVWGDGSNGGDYTSETNSFDWKLSNGCGFGIGSAPMHGIITEYDHANANDYNRPVNQEKKKTSQDHYQLFLNYDYNQYSAKGYLTSKWEQFNDKPFLTGVDGIGKGIVWQQGRMNHWRITSSYTGYGASDTVGYRENSNSGDPGFRGTAYQWMTPLMETVVDNDLIQSGGGNYLIKIYPPWMLGRGMTLPNPHSSPNFTNTISDNYERQWREQTSLMVFEYPFYLSKNSRTYTINIRPDIGTSATEFSWLANPTGQDIYLEMEFFDTDTTTDRLQQSRKMKRSNSGVDMNTNAWSQLSVTVTPKSEGVGYLRLWYAKERETGKVNTFYVDPKVVVY